MDAPERIWAWTGAGKINSGQWSAILQPNETEYIRADTIEVLQQELREAIDAMRSARESLYSLTHLLLPDEPGFEKAVDGLEELDAFLAGDDRGA
jgi:hypothetical protein